MTIHRHLSVSIPPLDLFSNSCLVQESKKKKWKRAAAEAFLHNSGVKMVT